MDKKIILAIVAVIVIVGGGAAAYYVTTRDETSSSDNSVQTSDEKPSSFEPKQTTDRDFTATLTTEGDEDRTTVFEYDKDKKAFLYASKANGQAYESITTEDAQYIFSDGKWLKYPVDQDQGTNFDPEAYQYDDEELRDYQSNVKYVGRESCSVGTCYVWTADTPTSKSTFYVSTKDNYIIKVETVVDEKLSTITYEYDDVTVEIPEDAEELPSFRSSL